MMTDLPTFLIAATSDDWTLQYLRPIGIGYWNQLKDVSNGSEVGIEAIKNIHIRIAPAFDRPILVSSPPYRGIDGAEGFAYVRYLIEHYQDRHSTEWKLVEQHLERVIKNAQEIANRQKDRELRSDRAKGTRNYLRAQAAKNSRDKHPTLATKSFWHIIRSELENLNANPEVDEKGVLWYTEDGIRKPIKETQLKKIIPSARKGKNSQ